MYKAEAYLIYTWLVGVGSIETGIAGATAAFLGLKLRLVRPSFKYVGNPWLMGRHYWST
ncbi:MAG: hypothetical protein QXX41_10860 [Nitrososphaerota archaeon]